MVFDVLQYIEGSHKNGSLAEISSRLNRPTYQIRRLLKKHTGCNFKELLGQQKLQQAAYLLSNTTLSVDAVITAIGYDNSSYFYRRFRERYGCSPTELRETQAEGRSPEHHKSSRLHFCGRRPHLRDV